MGIDLKCNLDEYKSSIDNFNKLKQFIADSKKNMNDGLQQIRKDWTLDGGVAFFESIDTDWVNSVQNCIDILDDLTSALESAYNEYNAIQEDSKTYLKF